MADFNIENLAPVKVSINYAAGERPLVKLGARVRAGSIKPSNRELLKYKMDVYAISRA